MGRRPALAAMGSVSVGALACTLALAHAPQLVRFAPAGHVSGETQATVSALDVQQLGRDLGGKPQLAKAILPQTGTATAPTAHRTRYAAVRRRVHRTPSPERLADLRMPPPPPAPSSMLVMTRAWVEKRSTAITSETRIVVTFAQTGSRPQVTNLRLNQPPPAVAPAAYAVVPIPDGWLVIQI